MDPSFAYAAGTLAIWIAWVAVFRAAYLAICAAMRREEARATLTGAGISGAVAAVGFLVGGQLLPADPHSALRLPLMWLMMPFTAWAAGVCGLMALVRPTQAAFAMSHDDKKAKLRASVVWLAFCFYFFWLFKRSDDNVEVLRGSLPLDFQTAAIIALLILGALAVMVAVARHTRAQGYAKGLVIQLSLLAGSVIFGLPFAWLLITSFKEDRDMSSPNGLVWVPRVTERVPYFDPDEPLAEGVYEGEPVQGPIVEKYPDGSAKVEIEKPAVLRGLTFVARPPLKLVPKMIEVVTADYRGAHITGKVIKDLPDGQKRVEVTAPANLKGATFDAKPEAITPVRPVGLKWQNYTEALDYLPKETNRGLIYLKNTLILVVLNVIGTILSSSIVAYAFARLRFPGKNALFLLLLSTMMLPLAVTLIPQFLIFRSLGWVDTLRPLWVPAFLGSAFNIFLLRQFFMGIPTELEDAAKIDGATYLRTYWQVMLPQVKPALAVVAIGAFLRAWNDFMGPLIYINSPETMPISYALQLFQGDRLAEPGLLMAFATMSMIPVLLVFFFAQRYFIEGVTLSGLGGR